MLKTRVIPVLLLKGNDLVKTTKFKKPLYIGDPINAIKIFNDKEVDELIFLDIEASKKSREPNYKLIESFATECFMPICYGGGITTIEQMKKIFKLGVEKISINLSLLDNLELLRESSSIFGSQSIVVSIDIKKNFFGNYSIYNHKKKRINKQELVRYVQLLEENGAGEIMINNVDLDGTLEGYDLKLIKNIKDLITIPLITCGGAKDLNDFKEAKDLAVSGVAAGSFFVFYGKHRAVLITYPQYKELEKTFGE